MALKDKKESYPEVFITGIIDDGEDDMKTCADGLAGWGNCMLGVDMPSNFGIGMAEISIKLGINATPDGLKEYAKAKGWI